MENTTIDNAIGATVAAQAVGIPDGLDEMEPGPFLAIVLSGIDLATLSGEDRIVVVQARQRMASHNDASSKPPTRPASSPDVVYRRPGAISTTASNGSTATAPGPTTSLRPAATTTPAGTGTGGPTGLSPTGASNGPAPSDT